MNTERHFGHYRGKKWMFFLLIFPLILFGLSYAVMWLWNAILPEVVHAGELGYWQAMGLLVLSRLLFGGFGFKGRHGPEHFHKARELREKWRGMSDEEKIKFREEWKIRCGKHE